MSDGVDTVELYARTGEWPEHVFERAQRIFAVQDVPRVFVTHNHRRVQVFKSDTSEEVAARVKATPEESPDPTREVWVHLSLVLHLKNQPADDDAGRSTLGHVLGLIRRSTDTDQLVSAQGAVAMVVTCGG